MSGCPTTNARCPGSFFVCRPWPPPTKKSSPRRRTKAVASAPGKSRPRSPGGTGGLGARAMDDFCRTGKIPDSSGQAHSGFLRYDDMAHWQAAVEKPLQLDFGRHTLMKCGFWSQGPVFLQQAGMLRHAGLAHCAPDTAGFVHGIAEAAKLALADRLA